MADKPLSADVIWQLWRRARQRHVFRVRSYQRTMDGNIWSGRPTDAWLSLSQWMNDWANHLADQRDAGVKEAKRARARYRAIENTRRTGYRGGNGSVKRRPLQGGSSFNAEHEASQPQPTGDCICVDKE